MNSYSTGLHDFPTIHQWSDHDRQYLAIKWGFLKPDIQGPTVCLIIDTDHGTEFLPDDIVSLPAFDSPSENATLLRLVRPYVNGEPEEISSSRNCFLCRLSAPGYMDCTDWERCDTEADVLEWLEDQASEVSDY